MREEGVKKEEREREKKKKRINASSTCMLEQLYTRFVTLFREFFDSSSRLRRDACKLSLKWPKLRSKFLLELLHTIIPQFAPLISPPFSPSLLLPFHRLFSLRGRESILNCTRTVFPFTRRFSETLKLAELLKRTRKRRGEREGGKLRSGRAIVKERWLDCGRETRVRNTERTIEALEVEPKT